MLQTEDEALRGASNVMFVRKTFAIHCPPLEEDEQK